MSIVLLFVAFYILGLCLGVFLGVFLERRHTKLERRHTKKDSDVGKTITIAGGETFNIAKVTSATSVTLAPMKRKWWKR